VELGRSPWAHFHLKDCDVCCGVFSFSAEFLASSQLCRLRATVDLDKIFFQLSRSRVYWLASGWPCLCGSLRQNLFHCWNSSFWSCFEQIQAPDGEKESLRYLTAFLLESQRARGPSVSENDFGERGRGSAKIIEKLYRIGKLQS
jgi:hypothetical protein